MISYVSPKIASQVLGKSTTTLRRWAKAGKIDHIRTPSGHFSYNLASVGVKPASQPETCSIAAPPPRNAVSRPVEPPPAAVSIPQAPKPRLDQAALRRAFEGLAMASNV